MRKCICCAGNMIVDITYPIETWPNQNELTHITECICKPEHAVEVMRIISALYESAETGKEVVF